MPELFFSNLEFYCPKGYVYALRKNLRGGKKRYDFLKFVKNYRILGHIFQILKFFKILFVASKGHIDDSKISLK